MGSHSFVSRYFPHFENKFLTKMGTALFSTSGLIKTAECFAVFTCLVIHRIGNRVSQVSQSVVISASKSSIRRFVITEKAPTRAFSWLKAATTAFTFKTLLRHYAKRVLTPR